MDKEELKALIIKYRSGQATDQEKAIFESWYLKYQEEETSSYAVEELLEDLNLVWRALEQKFTAQKTNRSWPWKTIATAAALAVIVSGIWLYTNQGGFSGSFKTLATHGSSELANDIAPGKNAATLILANGKTLKLSDQKTGIIIGIDDFIYNDSTVVDPSLQRHLHDEMASMSHNDVVLTTPRAGTYQITLPDGTKVWLNAASSIIFPSTLSRPASHQRKVELVGEAYFEVLEDKKRPFIVSSKGQEVEVLGTHFNINAYGNEPGTKTTLLEGSVKISLLKGTLSEVVLKPRQQATSTGSSINIKQIDPSEALAWKNGYFQFTDTPLEAVMRQVSRWYDVEVIYKNDAAKKVIFGGTIERKTPLSGVLAAITKTGEVAFRIEGKTIIVQ